MQGGYAGKYDRYSFLKGGKKESPDISYKQYHSL